MKRLLVFVFALTLLGSCNQQRELYIECEVVSSTDITYVQSTLPVLCTIGERCLTYMGMPAPPPISVGNSCESDIISVEKGQNIQCMISIECCSNTINTFCSTPFEIAHRIYINGNLEHTTILNETTVENNHMSFNYIVP